MIDETLEFQITQYLDGDLPAEAVAAFEERLGADADVREVLEQYRKLNVRTQRATCGHRTIPNGSFAPHFTARCTAIRGSRAAMEAGFSHAAWWQSGRVKSAGHGGGDSSGRPGRAVVVGGIILWRGSRRGGRCVGGPVSRLSC